MTTERQAYDAIVIGGGHNGLVAAAYLGRAGKRVLVLEAGGIIGGGALAAELQHKYMIPAVSHLMDGLSDSVVKDLKLARHGFSYAATSLPSIALDLDARHLVLTGRAKEDEALLSSRGQDAAKWTAFARRIENGAAWLAPLLNRPPLVSASASARGKLMARTMLAEASGERARETFLALAAKSVSDWIHEDLDVPLLAGLVAFDATLGSTDAPYDAGTAFRLIYRHALKAKSGVAIPRGGMGALAETLVALIEGQRGEVWAEARAKRVLMDGAKAVGVELDNGVEVVAPVILSGAAPRETLMNLVGARYLEAGLADRLSRKGTGGATAKINLALDGAPGFRGLTPEQMGGRLVIAPSLEEVEESALSARAGALPLDPVMEVVMPTWHDTGLAPEGHHIMSILVHQVPYEVEGGWEARREEFVQRAIRTICRYAPDATDYILAGEVLTPPDLETKYGIRGGDWHQGGLNPFDLLGLRPEPELAGYATPVGGLYLCGAGCHPGGGVTGLPGKFAAETVLEAEARGGRA